MMQDVNISRSEKVTNKGIKGLGVEINVRLPNLKRMTLLFAGYSCYS